ncbi:MAG TPA: NADH-ubiquinone oxidoreductase-F iron-sulfur binding region domain-containing protein [Candidatus Hydrogenedentes bacterium]|nr:NADH-ubiquinone oxidoreductase-F iron-sulfur binding region domain-containing protein [Candidatus Hydrogenedentota bacterium]HRT20234.1 NADH-ubiquinone oxidoreductase-F iron-sulfur binding region domain-containing protein [Candidatus Hydrogenedentota bacterium]HRT64296.1 NADH-ubiquinone oxidoreductase-F iron-sulfur binding region domain-containing protein [Candidatus Hydrogenedentota bacterium]
MADEAEIRIGLGSCCVAGGSAQIREALDDTCARFGLKVRIKPVSCVGMCHQTPLMEIVAPGQLPVVYAKVHPEDVPALVLTHFPPQSPMSRFRAATENWLERLYADGARQQAAIDAENPAVVQFLSVQRRIATECCGEMDPTDFDEYVRRGGLVALRHCIGRLDNPDTIIDVIERSGLRGRGGAGFPTARKWRAVSSARGADKCVICNGDEGDPGAFMDRMILESYTFRVIEGMVIASIAVGAHRGVFYIRAEYPLAVERVRNAIRKCNEAGMLGDNVLGSRHSFHAEVREGAGGFVCGEETALIASLEGRRPAPRYRPPFPAFHGLHGAPTLVNNVETLALVPWIMRNGAEAFAALGSGHSKGTKVFSLAGKIRRGGLIEVPMGVALRQIVEEIGGGVPDGRTLKAVQVGGPSGGCIPSCLADLRVDYESLAKAGSMMGSGGLVVMDDTDCMVEMARYFLSFTQLESCGKCAPCRIGTKEMLAILERLCEGRAKKTDLNDLERIAHAVKKQSLCGLGKTAPNPVLTGLRFFRDEFEAHAAGRCPAHKCKALVTYTITDDCIGCTKCAQRCPSGAIQPAPYEVHVINQTKCVRCNACYEICPVQAVRVE